VVELAFFSGTMDCGKSTVALQMDHDHSARGRAGLIFTSSTGPAARCSRPGSACRPPPARCPTTSASGTWSSSSPRAATGSTTSSATRRSSPRPPRWSSWPGVDEMAIDVFAFGITSDFRAQLFPGSQRLIELADRVEALQVEALCLVRQHCDPQRPRARRSHGGRGRAGRRRRHHARGSGVTEYEVLCRRQYMRRMTSHAARSAPVSPEVLPFDLDVRTVRRGGSDAEGPTLTRSR